MDYAVINIATKTIENVIVLEEGSEWTPPEGTQLVPLVLGFGINDTWDGTSFIRAPYVQPEQPETQSLTKEEMLAQIQALQAQINSLP